MTDKDITYAARQICSEQVVKADNDDWTHYLSGRYDHTALMRLVEQGIRRGLEWQTMIKTQHCPNCEATEQKLHNFQQEVSDAVVGYFRGVDLDTRLHRFIIPKPKPDPLVDAIESVLSGFESRKHAESYAHHIRAKLENSGFEIEIREKGQ
jgi:hypothetical protein